VSSPYELPSYLETGTEDDQRALIYSFEGALSSLNNPTRIKSENPFLNLNCSFLASKTLNSYVNSQKFESWAKNNSKCGCKFDSYELQQATYNDEPRDTQISNRIQGASTEIFTPLSDAHESHSNQTKVNLPPNVYSEDNLFEEYPPVRQLANSWSVLDASLSGSAHWLISSQLRLHSLSSAYKPNTDFYKLVYVREEDHIEEELYELVRKVNVEKLVNEYSLSKIKLVKESLTSTWKKPLQQLAPTEPSTLFFRFV
jgi:hypothetical protein